MRDDVKKLAYGRLSKYLDPRYSLARKIRPGRHGPVRMHA